MLRPFLIVGVGGSGGKTIRGLRHALELRLEQAGWERGIPAAWQMIHFDTPLKQDGADYEMPFIPATDYKGLVAPGAGYEAVHASIVARGIPAEVSNDVLRMFPDPGRVAINVANGAGQYRAVGRAVAVSKLDEISKVAAAAINRMHDAAALGELQSLGESLGARVESGISASPTVIVVSSIAGGSGAGQYLDVIEAVKAVVRNEPWAHQFYSMLYAPDVFDQIKGAAGIPSNALATVAETMSGFWTRTPSKATIELYRSKGVSPSFGAARDRVGARYPFIVGRQNSRVAFESQSDVYSAVSTSISAWMVDDRVQDYLDAYAAGNWDVSVGPGELPDATRLIRRADQAPAFSSIGFGRVSLGRDKFVDYASERLARSVLDRILFAHTEDDPKLEERTNAEWVELAKTQSIEAFVRELRLDEEAEGSDDVIDQLRPEELRSTLAKEFRQKVLDASAHGFDKKTDGLDLNEWHYRLLAARDDLADGYLARETAGVEERLKVWVAEAPDHIIDTIEKFIARVGIEVVVELMTELSRSLRAASENLAQEAEKHRGWASRVSGRVSESLGGAANADAIRKEQEVVDLALNDIEDSFLWEAEANLREVAAKLIVELRTNFIDVLAEHLSSARKALQSGVGDRILADGRENPYDNWPKRIDASVPRKYRPAPNERLLVAHTDYPAEFERLVEATFEKRVYSEAVIRAIEEVIQGPERELGNTRQPVGTFIEIRHPWRPATTGNRLQRASNPEKPRFYVADDLDSYQARAHLWMRRKGYPFFGYVTENLSDYFGSDVDPNRLKQRRDAYREGLTAALAASEPLVKLNSTLLAAVHGKSIGQNRKLVVSAIPFAEGSDMYQLTKDVLTTAGVWEEGASERWFKDAKVPAIEVFSMQGHPYHPMVMDSVMTPIARGWLTDSTNPDAREEFWKWKRARPLREAVPADPEVFDSIVRGWYVAKLLGQLKEDRSDADRGPKLSVWDSEARKFAEFPHPLLYPTVVPTHDYPGVIAESLIIALALCNAEGSIEPLQAYQALMRLGGQRTQPISLSPVLGDWVRDGILPQGSPVPNAARAGSPSGEMAERQVAVREHLDTEINDFRENVVRQDTDTSVFSYPVSWEIRDTVLGVLRELRDGVLETKQNSTGI